MRDHTYYVYITTNPKRTVLYIGVTNDLKRRLSEHTLANRGFQTSFAGRYFCYNLIYYECFQYIDMAIERETQLKKWSRAKKEALIATINPNWDFLNSKL